MPLTALSFSIASLTLAGVPPQVGFAGKVVVFAATLEGEMIWLAVIRAINMVIALYDYAAIVAALYLRAPHDEEPIGGGMGSLLALSLSVAGTLGLGMVPGPGLRLTQLIASLV
jgi:NADH-quinone oxidoreductase subunit N